MGNEIFHDKWREVTSNEFEKTQRYTQNILFAFYDHRPSALAELRNARRVPEEDQKKHRRNKLVV